MERKQEKDTAPRPAGKKRHWIWISALVLAVGTGSLLHWLDIPHISVKQGDGSMVITIGKEQKRNESVPKRPADRSWDEGQTLENFSRVVAPSMVTVTAAGEETDFGIIVSRNGYIVTCTQTVTGDEALKIRLTDGQEYLARTVGQDESNQLLLLKIDAADLTPVQFSGGTRRESQPVEIMGLTVDEIPQKVRIFFSLPHGVHVEAVEDGSTAMKSGLRPGDMITAVDDVAIRTPQDFCPMEKTEVKLTVFRDGVYEEIILKNS